MFQLFNNGMGTGFRETDFYSDLRRKYLVWAARRNGMYRFEVTEPGFPGLCHTY